MLALDPDQPMSAAIIRTDTIHQGWGRYLVCVITLPDGHTVRREIEDHGNATCVLPYDARRRTAMLVRQFRAPAFLAAGEEATLEAIAGIIEGPDPADCARREALEEAGVRLTSLEHVVRGWSMPGISTERMDLYLAPYDEADRVGPGGGIAEDHEGTTAVEIGLGELARMADAGALTDVKAMVLVQTLRLRRPELFR
jgi:nudix-type nucleoside diphosphatase (YffH/AdpP family)